MKNTVFWLTFILFLPFAIQAQKIITLDLQAALDNGDYELDPDLGNWVETYNTEQNTLSFNDGMFNFSHIPGRWGGTDTGDGMGYWDGFTICNSGDTDDYGELGDSDGWITRQWGCMAGGGLNSDFQTEKGSPYLVAYWGYHYEKEGQHCCEVVFDGDLHKVKGTYICNHPWPYYGNIHGDGFASPLDYEGAFFSVTAHGLIGGEDTGSSVTLMLAHYPDDETGLVQSADWQWLDLEELGEVDAIYFTLDTSDEDRLYGANTAVYFCLDRMQIYATEDNPAPQRPSGLHTLEVGEDSIAMAWRHVDEADHYILMLDGEEAGETADTIFIFRNLEAFTDYTLSVVAVNDNGQSDIASIQAKTIDITPPEAPLNLTAGDIQAFSATLTWDAAADNVGVDRYRIWLNGVQEARPRNNSYPLSGLEAETEYTVEVEAVDASGNVSEKATITFTTAEDPAGLEELGVKSDKSGVDKGQSAYDLSGRKINYQLSTINYQLSIINSQLPKGIYIINGKKYISR